MSWSEKIDNKKYLFGTIVNIGFALYAGWPQIGPSWWLVYVVLATVGNHYFMVKALSRLVLRQSEEAKPTKSGKLFFYVLAKTLFLASAFLCLLVFNRDYVLHGLLIYIFQLIILFLSIKNIGKFFKKGTPP